MSREAVRLYQFVQESNRIEGIHRDPTEGELMVHAAFLSLRTVAVADIEGFVWEVAGVPLRRAVGQDVRVAGHLPPPGGPDIESDLISILGAGYGAYDTHVAYELLHPFMDGNGRSGRVLWAWMMKRDECDPFALPFLHRFYYQALDAAR